MKKLLTALCFVLVASLSCLAQETYTWKKENIKVTFPAGMKVVDDDGDGRITVKSDNAVLQLEASLNPALDDDDKSSALIVKLANNIDLNLDEYDTDEFECADGSGAGFYIIGEHKKKDAMCLVSIARSNTEEGRFMLTVAIFDDDAAKSVGQVLGSISFLD
jgi:hypothetical protein